MNSPANSQTALVTGASRGLGRAIAERLARDGWSVALVARQADKLQEVRTAIEAAGGKASVHTADISDPKSADQVIANVEKESGPLAALINNAGITKDGLVMRMEDADWCSVIDTNLTGAFRWIRAASRGMLKARKGRIVNIGSVVGLVGNAGQANYAAAKAGLKGGGVPRDPAPCAAPVASSLAQRPTEFAAAGGGAVLAPLGSPEAPEARSAIKAVAGAAR